jgi:hypothetical protein
MDLSQVYSKQIKKRPVNMLQVGGDFPQIERDPTFKQLENDVFNKMRSIMPKEEARQAPKDEVVPLSFQDALKELLDFQKNKCK